MTANARDETVLAIDAIGDDAAAMVWRRGGGALAECREIMPRGGGADRLIGVIERAIDESGVGWSGVGRLVVAAGPGSFTGVRIGVAAARGLALSLGAPAVGVDGFEAIAVKAARSGAQPGRVAVVFGRAPRLVWRLYEIASGEARPAEAGGADERGDADALRACGATLFLGPAAEAAAPLPARASGLDLATVAELGADAPWSEDHERPAPIYLRAPDATPPSLTPPVRLDGQ